MTRKILFIFCLILLGPFPLMAQGNALAKVARGQYIFAVEGGCGCHNPEGQPANVGGAKRENPYVLVFAPNITPDPETGIGKWSVEDIANFLRTGVRPDGSRAGSIMANLIKKGMKDITPEDARVMALYLKSVPPVKNIP